MNSLALDILATSLTVILVLAIAFTLVAAGERIGTNRCAAEIELLMENKD